MTKLNELKRKLLECPDVRADCDSLTEEFSIAEALIRARAEADMTQEQVAQKIQTSQSYLAKLESGRSALP